MNMNISEFNNVTVSKKMRERMEAEGLDNVKAHSMLAELVKHVAINNPLWRLVGLDGNAYSENKTMVLTKLAVMKDSETLGYVFRDYVRREYRIVVKNERISKSMQRGAGYSTGSWEKAASKIKRAFVPLSVYERMDKAHSEASRCVTNQIWERERNIDRESRHYEINARDWALGAGRDMFVNYVKTQLPPTEGDRLLKAIDIVNTTHTEMITIKKVRDHLGQSGTTLVIKDCDTYLVKTLDNVQVYDDNTLPHNLRVGVGMLKLVEVEHFISNVGCRVSDEVFVLLVDEEPNNVMEAQ
jgi:hypothetical protein